MGFIAPIAGALASGVGAIGSGIASVGGSLLGGLGSIGGALGGASGLGSIASGVGSLLGGVLGGGTGGGGIGVPGTAGGTFGGGGGGLGGLGGLGRFLGDLIPVAAGLAKDESGSLDVQNVNVMTPEQANLLKIFSEQSAQQAGRKALPFAPGRTAGNVLGQAQLSNMIPRILGAFGDPRSFIGTPESAANTFETGIANPARTNFFEETAPRLRAGFGAVNAGSSSAFNRQVATQCKNLERDLAAQKALFLDNARRQRVENALGLTQAVGGLASQAFSQQSLEQAQRDREFAEFLRMQEAPGLSQLAGTPLQSTAFQAIAQRPQASPFAPLLENFGRRAGSGGLFGGGGSSPFNNLSSAFA